MTDEVEEQAARERLERERARVGELIASLRGEGLDVEQSAQSGDIARFDANQEDQAQELNEREKDLAILEGLESDLAEIEAALQRLDDGTYGIDEVRAHRPRPPRRTADSPHERPTRDVIVRLLLFAGAREAAGCSKADFEVDDGASLSCSFAGSRAFYGDPFARVLKTGGCG